MSKLLAIGGRGLLTSSNRMYDEGRRSELARSLEIVARSTVLGACSACARMAMSRTIFAAMHRAHRQIKTTFQVVESSDAEGFNRTSSSSSAGGPGWIGLYKPLRRTYFSILSTVDVFSFVLQLNQRQERSQSTVSPNAQGALFILCPRRYATGDHLPRASCIKTVRILRRLTSASFWSSMYLSSANIKQTCGVSSYRLISKACDACPAGMRTLELL